MKQQKLLNLTAILTLGLSLLSSGCARTVSRTQETRVSPTGRVTTKEKTVTQNPDGTINQTETHKTIRP